MLIYQMLSLSQWTKTDIFVHENIQKFIIQGVKI